MIVPFRSQLKVRIVVGLLLISIVPLVVSFLLIGRIAEVAQNFSSHRVERLLPLLDQSQVRYRELIRAKKELYQHTATHWADEISELAAAGSVSTEALQTFIEQRPTLRDLRQLEIIDANDQVESAVAGPAAPPSDVGRDLQFKQPIRGTPRSLRVTFLADQALLTEHTTIAEELDTARKIDSVDGGLPGSYRLGFFILVGGVVVLVTTFGLILAVRIGRRIEALVAGTQQIATGDLAARVQLSGGDELAYLGQAFNTMVEHLEQDRDKINYLQRIGAWQEVARRLAHEIKNPLTPIRLAVQQTVSTYNGDDERFRKQLKVTEEIVNEEIENLRRLVDAFTLLGRLPRVDPRPLKLSDVMGDIEKDPTVSSFVEQRPSPEIELRGDRLLLRRVLINLVENGHHAGVGAGKPGNVVVSWIVDSSSRAHIYIDDEGPGLSDELRRKVFEPYYTTKETGSGLGLAIAKKIAIDHGGALEISPQRAPTGGARFILTLPLADRNARATDA